MLTVRDMGVARQPVRLVASRQLDLPLMSQLARSARDVPLWICHGPDAGRRPARTPGRDLGARLIECDLTGRQLDMSGSCMAALGREGLTRVFCEGGGALAASLLAAGSGG